LGFTEWFANLILLPLRVASTTKSRKGKKNQQNPQMMDRSPTNKF